MSATGGRSSPPKVSVSTSSVARLFRKPDTVVAAAESSSSSSSSATSSSTIKALFLADVYDDPEDSIIVKAFTPYWDYISQFRFLGNYDAMKKRYSVLITLSDPTKEVEIHDMYKKMFGKMQQGQEWWFYRIEHILEDGYNPLDYIELPLCPFCHEQVHQNTSGSGLYISVGSQTDDSGRAILGGNLNCQVCELYEKQDAEPRCCRCDSSNDIWVCMICWRTLCGSRESGHFQNHLRTTNHAYFMEIASKKIGDCLLGTFFEPSQQRRVEPGVVKKDSSSTEYLASKVEEIRNKDRYELATKLEALRNHYKSLGIMCLKASDDTAIITERAIQLRKEKLTSKLITLDAQRTALVNENARILQIKEEKERFNNLLKECDRKLELFNKKVEEVVETTEWKNQDPDLRRLKMELIGEFLEFTRKNRSLIHKDRVASTG